MDDSTKIEGKLYLVKVKERAEFGSRDLLWAIGQRKTDPLDFNGLKSIL